MNETRRPTLVPTTPREHLDAALEHFEAAAEGEPGRLGLAFAEVRCARTRLLEDEREEAEHRDRVAQRAAAEPATPFMTHEQREFFRRAYERADARCRARGLTLTQ